MLKCKICGGSRITSADGELFVCADCGCNYTLEAARRLMQSEESAPAAAPESKRASRPVPRPRPQLSAPLLLTRQRKGRKRRTTSLPMSTGTSGVCGASVSTAAANSRACW